MAFSSETHVSYLIYVALFFTCAGYLARDELRWRPLMLIGSGFYLAYYYLLADTPLWDSIFTNGLLAVSNLVMIVVVIAERSTFGMSSDTLAVYQLFPMLSPGHFRRLMKIANRHVAVGARAIVTEGEVPKELHFVLRGPIEIRKGGLSFTGGEGVFIAEVAFLTGAPASATVVTGPGADYLSWDVQKLQQIMLSRPRMRAALVASLNLDLAHKVAKSQPAASGTHEDARIAFSDRFP